MTAHRKTSLLLTLTLMLAAAGCDDTTGPEDRAMVSASMTDGGAAQYFVSPAATSGSSAPAQAAAASGNMSGSAQVAIYSEAHGWVSLDTPQNASLTLQSGNETTLATSASVPAGTYTRVRLMLNGFHVNLAAGSSLGGVILDGAVDITVGGADGYVEIEKEVSSFRLEANQSASVRFNLNSQAWVTQESAQAQSAADAAITAAATATVVAG